MRQATTHSTPKSETWNVDWAAVRLRPEPGSLGFGPQPAPLHPQARHPGWLTPSLQGSVADGPVSSRRGPDTEPPVQLRTAGVPGAGEPAGLPGEEGLPRSTWRTVRGERGANIRNHESSRMHGGGTFKCCILNLYKEMKNLGCDSGSQISSVLRQSFDTTGFLGVAPQPGPQAKAAAPVGAPGPMGSFPQRAGGWGGNRVIKTHFPALFLVDEIIQAGFFLLIWFDLLRGEAFKT